MKLSEIYKIEADTLSLKLVQIKKAKEESKSKTIETTIGYYSNTSQLYNAILQKEIKDNFGDFTKLINSVKKVELFIKELANQSK